MGLEAAAAAVGGEKMKEKQEQAAGIFFGEKAQLRKIRKFLLKGIHMFGNKILENVYVLDFISERSDT